MKAVKKSEPELELILAIISNNSAKIHQILKSARLNWQYLYKLIIRHRIWPQVVAGLDLLKLTTPLTPQLQQFYAQDKLKQLSINAEVIRISREFTKQQLLHCFVKGIILNTHIYRNLIARPCRDIDLWVSQQDLEQAIAILQTLGYSQSLPQYKLTGFKQKYYFKHKHDLAFYHPKRTVLVELHFRLDYFGINFFKLSPTILQPIVILNTSITTLKDEYHILYLMLHAAVHAYSRLRWLQDIALYIKAYPEELTKTFKLSEELNCKHLVEQCLLLLQDLLNMPIPPGLTPSITPQGQELAQLATKFVIADYEISAGSGVSRRMFYIYRYYLAKIATKGQKVKAVVGDLIKIDRLFPYLTLPSTCSWLYYLIYPFWVILYIIKPTIGRQNKQRK